MQHQSLAVRGERLTRALAIAEVRAQVDPGGLKQLIHDSVQLSKATNSFSPTERFLKQLGKAKVRMAEVDRLQSEAIAHMEEQCAPALSQINPRGLEAAIAAAKEVGLRDFECAALRSAQHKAEMVRFLEPKLLRLLERERMEECAAATLHSKCMKDAAALAKKTPAGADENAQSQP